MIGLHHIVAFVAVSLIAISATAQSAGSDSGSPMTADEFKLFRDYQAALTDVRVQKMPKAKRIPAIAKNFAVNEAVLRAAIKKCEQSADTVEVDGERTIRALFDQSSLAKRIQEIKIDATSGHVVTYVSWKNADRSSLEFEASLVAGIAAAGAPITSTVALWANDSATGQKVFSATVAASVARTLDRGAPFPLNSIMHLDLEHPLGDWPRPALLQE